MRYGLALRLGSTLVDLQEAEPLFSREDLIGCADKLTEERVVFSRRTDFLLTGFNHAVAIFRWSVQTRLSITS